MTGARQGRPRRPVAELAHLDLNLLVVLRELIRERSVTRAAERVAVSQPAASAALGRLRRHFGDELLVRSGGDMVLTPLAAHLADSVELACAAAERAFCADAEFDPATSVREFTLLMADYVIAVLGGPLSRLLAGEAPRMRLHLRVVRESLAEEARDAIGRLDGLVAPPFASLIAPDLRSVELFRDRWVCIGWRGAPLGRAAAAPTVADLQRLDWVIPYLADRGQVSAAPVAQQLALLGIQPSVAVRVESYTSVPELVSGTDRVALIQERLAVAFADHHELRVMDVPGEAREIVEALWWSDEHDADPAHVWLRGALARVAAELPAPLRPAAPA